MMINEWRKDRKERRNAQRGKGIAFSFLAQRKGGKYVAMRLRVGFCSTSTKFSCKLTNEPQHSLLPVLFIAN